MAKSVSEKDIKTAWEVFAPKYGGQKEDYFAPVYLAREFGGATEDYIGEAAFGNNDFGLDAFHIDREKRNLYLFQFKWSANHNLFKESLKRLVEHGMERVFGNPHGLKEENAFLGRLRATLFEDQAIIKRVMVVFVFNGEPETAEKSAGLDALRERLESQKHLINEYFGESQAVDLAFEFRSNETKGKSATHIKKTHRYPLRLAAPLVRSLEAGENLHVGFVRLRDIYSIYVAMQARLFERNIRFGLGQEVSANRSLRKAFERIVIAGLDSPALFAFNHNGITLSAQKIDFNDGESYVTEPRVLNGAQTVTTFARFVEEFSQHPDFKRNIEKLDQIEVLAKVIEPADDAFVVGVTICTNRQTPVEPWNLRASEQIQLDLEDKFREDLKLFYERQEESWESYAQADIEEMGIDPDQKPLQIRQLARTFLAVQGEIDRMSRLAEVFEDEKQFRRAFPEFYLRVRASRIVLVYKIALRKRALLRHLAETKGSTFDFIQKGWNLTWALLAQGVLNRKDASELEERFGQSLTMEADYTELLRTLLVAKVAPAIKRASGQAKYLEQRDAGKFTFMRTKAFFEACMTEAETSAGWEKRSF
ncbi:MAG: AIPR family protein [Candidatus Moraniibacteriota bacterium]